MSKKKQNTNTNKNLNTNEEIFNELLNCENDFEDEINLEDMNPEDIELLQQEGPEAMDFNLDSFDSSDFASMEESEIVNDNFWDDFTEIESDKTNTNADLNLKNKKDLDLVKVFFNDLKLYPILSAEQEVELFERIANACTAEEMLKSCVDTSDEEKEFLKTVVVEGKKAKDTMVNSNVRLVVSIAKKYAHYGMELTDLVGEGCIGLMTAVGKFDHNRGNKFSTYAVWWIRLAITRAIQKSSGKMVSSRTYDKVLKMKKFQSAFMSEFHREPNNEELCAFLDVDMDKLLDILKAAQNDAYLDATFNKDGTSTLEDVIGDCSHSIEDEVEQTLLAESLLECMDEYLTEREKNILACRFGLEVAGGKEMTLAEVAAETNMSRENVRHIQNEAIKKLNQNKNCRSKLIDYL